MGEWVVHGTRRLYESRWVNLELVDVELPDGQRFEHHVVRMQRVAGAVVVDAESRVLLLWRHRFITGTWAWEIPIGIVEPGEEPAATAAREVEEETGWRPGPLRRLVSYQPCPGIADTPHELFVAEGAERAGAPTEANEADRVEWLPLSQAVELAGEGKVQDAPSLIGLMRVALLKGAL
jgi:8-oxo-dGTP pyrophosphatase MutT (NUDIX family)